MTGDGSSEPDEHAEPVETATPCMSRLISRPSPSIPRKESIRDVWKATLFVAVSQHAVDAFEHATFKTIAHRA
jgi:hypothetical protein